MAGSGDYTYRYNWKGRERTRLRHKVFSLPFFPHMSGAINFMKYPSSL